jgi:MtrB/PioB family decaheme-associated outer membrane protein
MKPKLISILVASLFVPALAQAQEQNREWSGSVSFGLRAVGLSTNDPSKFTEYRDLDGKTQPIGAFELRRRGADSYVNAYGENLARDDMYLDLNGGRYGSYKYRLFSDQLRHTFGAGPGARTPFNGVGGTTLTHVPNPNNPTTWNTFDHSYKRHNFGGIFELQSMSPWYFRVDANEVKRDGINVFAGAKGTSPGNGFNDLPAPIDYTARNYSGEVGYSSRRSHFAVNLMHSTFDNGNETLRWQNNFFGGGPALLDTTVLPPSNELTRIALNGNLRQLPMDSILAGRFTYSTLQNDVNMITSMLSTGGVMQNTNPSEGTFHGNHKTTTASLSLASRPSQALDTKLYWNYNKLKNDSTDVIFSPSTAAGVNLACGGTICEPEMFHYKKNNFGLEGGYRLSGGNKLSAGVDYQKTDRERADFPRTKELKLFGEWKNSSLDSVTGRIKYQFLNRRSDFEPKEEVLAANPMDLYVRRFDLSNSHQHLLKLAADATLGGGFDAGFEVIYKDTQYKNVPLGRTGDNRQEYYASLGWGDPKSLRFLVFGDLEYAKYESNHRVGTGDPNPANGSNATTYNWNARNEDTSWQVGIGADWAPRSRLTLKTSLLYAQTNGEADFSREAGAPTTPLIPIRNFDNTRRTTFNLRAIYEYTRQWQFTGGYAYEKYAFNDVGYEGLSYVAGTGTSASYVTGQFAFQPYSANIVYAIAKYRF